MNNYKLSFLDIVINLWKFKKSFLNAIIHNKKALDYADLMCNCVNPMQNIEKDKLIIKNKKIIKKMIKLLDRNIDNSKYCNENEILKKEKILLTNDNTNLQLQVETLTNDNTNLQSQISGLNNSNLILRNKFNSSQANNLRLQSEVELLTTDKQSLQSQIEVLTTDKQSLQSQIEVLTTDKQSLQSQLDELIAVNIPTNNSLPVINSISYISNKNCVVNVNLDKSNVNNYTLFIFNDINLTNPFFTLPLSSYTETNNNILLFNFELTNNLTFETGNNYYFAIYNNQTPPVVSSNIMLTIYQSSNISSFD